jgi:hypothetical protein
MFWSNAVLMAILLSIAARFCCRHCYPSAGSLRHGLTCLYIWNTCSSLRIASLSTYTPYQSPGSDFSRCLSSSCCVERILPSCVFYSRSTRVTGQHRDGDRKVRETHSLQAGPKADRAGGGATGTRTVALRRSPPESESRHRLDRVGLDLPITIALLCWCVGIENPDSLFGGRTGGELDADLRRRASWLFA